MGEGTSKKPRVLMIAYACNPKGSGEHWLGWGWAEQAARAYEVELITPLNHQAEVAAEAARCGIKVHFVGVPPTVRKVSNYLGGVGSWWRKLRWQTEVFKVAKKLHQQNPFALVHQTTFHTFRVPFRAAELDIPSVWGPVAGGESVPPGFSKYLGSSKFSEFNRRLINQISLSFPATKRSLARASAIFVSNRTTLNFLPTAIHGKCVIVPPNALRPEDENPAPRPPKIKVGSTLRLLYVGNCVATRAVPIVFDALIESRLKDFKFAIVGKGPAIPGWKKKAAELGLADKIDFVGQVPQAALAKYYEEADALVFPALRDSGGSALLEAMSRNLPVICLDWAGPGEMVGPGSGLKIPVDNPARTVTEFAAALKRIQSDPALGVLLAREAQKRSQALFCWEEKFRVLQSCYARLIKRG